MTTNTKAYNRAAHYIGVNGAGDKLRAFNTAAKALQSFILRPRANGDKHPSMIKVYAVDDNGKTVGTRTYNTEQIDCIMYRIKTGKSPRDMEHTSETLALWPHLEHNKRGPDLLRKRARDIQRDNSTTSPRDKHE